MQEKLEHLSSRFKITTSINVDIVSFIEHPMKPGNIIAATSSQLLSIDKSGNCWTIAGIDSSNGCTYIPNNLEFNTIIHIAHINFTKVTTSRDFYNVEYSIAVACRKDYCIKFIDLESRTEHARIGVCNLSGQRDNDSAVKIDAAFTNNLLMKKPYTLSVTYFVKTIVIVISCAKNAREKLYNLVIIFSESEIVAHEYPLGGKFTTMADQQFGVIQHVVAPNEHTCNYSCSLFATVHTTRQSYKSDCCGYWYQMVAAKYENFLFVIPNNVLNAVIWSNVANNHTSLEPFIRGLDASEKLKRIRASYSTGLLMAYISKSTSFHYIGLDSGVRKASSKFRETFTRNKNQNMCRGNVISRYSTRAVGSCIYQCTRQLQCVAISFNVTSTDCYLHDDLILFGVSISNTVCYYIILQDGN